MRAYVFICLVCVRSIGCVCVLWMWVCIFVHMDVSVYMLCVCCVPLFDCMIMSVMLPAIICKCVHVIILCVPFMCVCRSFIMS